MSEEILLKKALKALQENNARIERYEKEKTEPIAVIGIGCRFPGGVYSPETFWQLLENETDAIQKVPESRWNLGAFPGVSAGDFVPYAGLLDNVDQFDASFFRISSREAKSMDPQQRLLLEVTWEALENAGTIGERRIEETGVFVGITQAEYGNLLIQAGHTEQIDSFFSTGNSLNVAAGRISYLLGFQGPSMAVDTACSSSLVSLHLACQSLRNQECRQAVAGGVNLLLTPFGSIATTRAQMLAKDGRCKAFDEAADGYVRSEGCGMVVLKRLSDALADGDTIRAVIRASGVSQDGASSGLTVPNGPAQQKLIRQVLERAKLTAADIDYIEAHGTGTSLGDPIEFGALGQVFGKSHTPDQPLWMGTVKSNIGHLESAAGIAGFIKAVLCLQHQKLVSNLHFQTPSSHIDWQLHPIQVVVKPMPWLLRSDKRRAGVSSFGFSGTNAHLILEEAPLVEVTPVLYSRPEEMVCLSAKNETALRQLAESYVSFLKDGSELWQSLELCQSFPSGYEPFPDFCHTTRTGRVHFEHRLAVRAASAAEAQNKLTEFLAGKSVSGVRVSPENTAKPIQKLAFLFTGQGAQYADMGKQLYQSQPVFQKAVDQCGDILTHYLNVPLLDILYPTHAEDERIHQTQYAQPVLFVLEYALAKLWQAWGVQPSVLVGHSIGEYVAACLAGIFSLEDALKLVAARGQLMQALPATGRMLVVFAAETVVQEALQPFDNQVCVAAVNGPAHIVVSGEKGIVDTLEAHFQINNIRTHGLKTSHAFHSSLMEPMLADFEAVAASVSYAEPRLDVVSTLTGTLVSQEMSQPAYWVRQIREAVQFQAAIEAVAQQGVDAFLEIGPSPTLTSICNRLDACRNVPLFSSLTAHTDNWTTLLDTVSGLYVRGYSLHWTRLDEGYSYRRISLPTYPFQRKSYWVTASSTAVTPVSLSTSTVPPVTTVAISDVQEKLISILATLLEEQPADISLHMPFLEMGADSILLMEAGKKIEHTFGIEIPLRLFFDELQNIELLAAHIASQVQPTVTTPPSGAGQVLPREGGASFGEEVKTPLLDKEGLGVVETPGGSSLLQQPTTLTTPNPSLKKGGEFFGTPSLNQILAQQLALNSQLIALLQGNVSQDVTPTPAPVSVTPTPAALPKHELVDPFASFRNKTPHDDRNTSASIEELRNKGLTETQQRHLAALTERINQRTARSKAFADQSRSHLADNRASAGFRYSTKEMLYPLVGHASKGSRIWDLDGNEYLDISMGFGVNLFGHNADFIEKAIQKQLTLGMQLGPQSELSAEVARRLSALTGVERVAFCNSGTEAIMTALRLARARTGRQKIALFAGSYHGHFDGVLGTARSLNEDPTATAVAAGIPASYVQDVLVLDYDNPLSLDLLRQHAHELAGVLVEPVQSRRPHLQPREFLHQLRALTHEAHIPLIFDEVITGFRIHPGGAQAHFGIQADLVTYGKIIGGGLPIGIVAGKADYMDTIDGGNWNYGDTTYPRVETTFFAGTFCKHPLTMAASLAVLEELETKGTALQEAITAKTTFLAEELNRYFTEKGIGIQMVTFGSLFRFSSKQNIDLLFYHLLEKGVYVWEGRNCFLSTAHTDEDIHFLIAKVKESTEELIAGGFLQAKGVVGRDEKVVGGPARPAGGDANNGMEKHSSNEKNTQNDSVNGTSSGQADEPKPVQEPVVLPATLAQRQLWLIAEIDKDGSIAYNLSANMELTGLFDANRMNDVLVQLVHRHEALRTVFSADGQQMRILPELPVTCGFTDLSMLEGDAQTEQFRQWNSTESRTPFDFTHGPLFRCAVIKLSDQKHVIAFTVHHIVLDGWSVVMLLKEIGMLYASLAANEPVSLAEPMQFREFVSQLEATDPQKKEQARQYWLQEFADGVPALELPLDFPRPRMKTHAGDRISEILDRTLLDNLKKIGQKNGCTLFMTLLSTYAVLLHKMARQQDFVMGVPSAKRFLPGSETVAGYCSHLLPLRHRFTDTLSFPELLKATRTLLLDGFANENFSFSELVEKLNERENMINNPFTRAVFNLDPKERLPELHGLQAQFISTPLSFSSYDLMLNIIELDDSFAFEWDYNTDLFESDTIRLLSGYFKNLLRQLVQNPSQPIRDLSLMSAEEISHRWKSWDFNKMLLPAQATIHGLIEAQAEQTPDAIALIHNDQTYTYQQLIQRADEWVNYLNASGIQPGQHVGVCMEKSLDWVAATLAIWKTASVAVSVDPTAPASRLEFIWEETKPVRVLKMGLEEEKKIQVRYTSEKEEVTAPSSIYIVYTSGSTGKPKGIEATHQGVVNYLTYLKNTFHLSASDVVVQLAPAGFDASVRDTFGPLLAGAAVVLGTDSRDFTQVLAAVRRHRATCLLSTVPFLLSGLADQLAQESDGCPSLRLMLVSGEVLTTQVARKVMQAFGKQMLLVNQYGPTECTMTSTYFPIHQLDERYSQVSIGRPIPNAEVYILNDTELAPDGTIGEICIGGKGLATGYLERPELTAEKFVTLTPPGQMPKRLYRTGDLGRFHANGTIEFLGRADNQVKVRGFRVELDEIETVLRTYPLLKSGVVLAEADATGETTLVAYVVPRLFEEITLPELMQFLESRLPSYALPAQVHVLDHLPLTLNGKIDRKALKAHSKQLNAGNQMVAPGNASEEILATIWKELLGLETVSIHDEFFHLGGNSLKAIQLIGRVHKKFGKLLTVADIFAHPTIHQLSLLLEETGHVVFQSIPKLPEQELYELSHAQRRLWIVDQFEENQIAYNIAVQVTYHEPIDLAAFYKAFDVLVERHESLRTVFINQGGTPYQKILSFEETGFAVQYKDLTPLDEATKAAAIEAETTEEPFDLSKGPLLRVRLLQTGAEHYVIYCSTHHIVSDGWSMNVLLNEVLKLYQAFSNGLSNPLPPLKIQYKDYAGWQNSQLQEEALQKHATFWKTYFAGPLLPLELPYDKKRPDVHAFQGEVIPFEIDATLATALRELSHRKEATLFMNLVALVQVLLYRYSGQKDIRIGIPMAGRERRELESQIGFYIHTLGLRSVLQADESFEKFLERTKANLLETHPHAIYPFDRIVEDLGIQTSPGRTPLFDVMVQAQDTHMAMVQEENAIFIREGAISTHQTSSKFDLTFNFTILESDPTIEAHIEYNTDLFFRTTVEKLRDDLLYLMRQVVATPDLPVSDSRLLPLHEASGWMDDFTKPLNQDSTD